MKLSRRSLLQFVPAALAWGAAAVVPIMAAKEEPKPRYLERFVLIKAGQPDANSDALLDWLKAVGIEARDTYQLLFDLDAMTVTVYQHERNKEGFLYSLRRGGPVAREPYTVAISTLPMVKSVMEAWVG